MRNFLCTCCLFVCAWAGKAQNMPQNIREHLSLWHLGRIDSTYLVGNNLDTFHWSVMDTKTAIRNPPTGIITSYSLHLVPFKKTAWLVELSHAYQHDSERLELTYFDGKKYEKIIVPYEKLETLAKKNLPAADTVGLHKGNLFFEVEDTYVICRYQKGGFGGYHGLSLVKLVETKERKRSKRAGEFAIIELKSTRYKLSAL